MKKSNCLFCGITLWWRLHKRWKRLGKPIGREPYLIMRFSRLEPRWLPHFLVGRKIGNTTRLVVLSYKPNDDSKLRWHKIYKVIKFEGKIHKGD